jgi:hypothetical protein
MLALNVLTYCCLRDKVHNPNLVGKMARLKFNVTDELMKDILAEADRSWPKQGMVAVRRLVRDSLRRLWRYCGGKGTARR